METTTTLFDSMVHKSHIWVNEVRDATCIADTSVAYRTMRAVLQALRDQLDVNEASQLAAQMPALVRGIYYEGWRPAKPHKVRTADEFFGLIMDKFGPEPHCPPAQMVQGVFDVLHRNVGKEFDQVVGRLPAQIRNVWIHK